MINIMTKNKWKIGIAVLASLFLAVLVMQEPTTSSWFVEHDLPLKQADRFFDIGIVDANGDNNLDIFTSNHHFRQALLVADGQGSFRDVTSVWGLDQSREFPLAELSFAEPQVDKPGLYIYWISTQLVIRTHDLSEVGQLQGSLQAYTSFKVMKNDGFSIDIDKTTLSKQEQRTVSETKISFTSNVDTDAYLRLKPGGQGVPLEFNLRGTIQPTQIYVGLGKVSPLSDNFSLTMRDRHAMAWADYNNDNRLDIFINRGALSGMLRAYPDALKLKIKDELLETRGTAEITDAISESGITKKDCSGRHARWVDLNRDNLLDLFINCHDRKHVAGEYPKQLYRQDIHGRFRDVAQETGLGIPDQQIGSLTWIDVDDDGDVDLVTLQNEGFFLYRNQAGLFSREIIYQRPLAGPGKIGDTTEGVWVYDGKITVADYDKDGDPDIFSASKRGNLLLKNHAGNYTPIKPADIGLPESSFNASWVDYDNDGLPDLFTAPQGLHRQKTDHTFASTGLLKLPPEKYQAAVSNWFDLDNDGRLDLLLALNENPAYERWWDFSEKARFRTTWQVKAYRNIRASNHWLQIKLIGKDGNRQAIGARVVVTTPSGQEIQEVGSTDGAFFSQGHYRLYFGLGSHAKADTIMIHWPDGHQQELKNIAGDKLHVISRNPETKSSL